MRKILLSVLLQILFSSAFAGRVTGIVTDEKNNALPFASILIKGSTRGTTTNNEGKYFLELEPGNYTIVAQYVGYGRVEKKITIDKNNIELNFQLSQQQLMLNNVVVKSGGEDPAYEIIRNAIRKRKDYNDPLDSFTCEAYIKTLIKTRKLPDKILGKKIPETDRKQMGVDSAGKGIIYLSESLTKIAYKRPDKTKLEVLSGRESGSNGYGFNFPVFVNFYENNVNVLTTQFAPRGFVSPIADGALNFYKYHYLGSFYEDGKLINQIQVIPKRKFEPLFSGTINITEDDWRIHSLDLLLTKQSQLELLDTLRIKQIHFPVTNDIWRTKDEVIYFTFSFLGVDATGNFLNVYNKYELNPSFTKKYFNNIIIKYDTAINKKSKNYWDSIRPVPLEPEELKDYTIKDSIYKTEKDSAFSKRRIDSLRKAQGKITVKNILLNGFTRSNFDPSKWTVFRWEPLFKKLQYNTAEGLELNVDASLRRAFPKIHEQIIFTPHVQYGFNNRHLNASGSIEFFKRNMADSDNENITRNSFILSGGKRISQFNNANPILPISNTVNTLLFNRNYMKIYENWFGEFTFKSRLDNGLQYSIDALYEDRLPINNTTNFAIIKYSPQKFTPNYPSEKIPEQFQRHQAFVTTATIQFQPGQQYMQMPHEKVPLGSKYPTFQLQYSKGFQGILGSDENFDKWNFSFYDNINFKLGGLFKYRFSVGGFLNAKSVFIQDYQHFNGNRLFVISGDYMNTFLAAPYYANSTIANFFTTAHIEHHFNGLLTNKIPLFKKQNIHFVAGADAFYVNHSNNYFEIYGGLENIFKTLRIDFVNSYLNGGKRQLTVRLGLGGLLGNIVRFD